MKITDIFPIPDTVNLVSNQIQMGPYTIGFHQPTLEMNEKTRLVIIGSIVFDLSSEPIVYTSIIPADKNWIDKHINGCLFDLEDDVVYHVVSYNKNAWVLPTLDSAMGLLEIIYEFKAIGLLQRLNQKDVNGSV